MYKRQLQFVYNDYESGYEELLERAGLSALSLNRLRQLAVEIYKTVNDIGPEYLKEVFSLRKSKYALRGIDNLALEKPSIKSTTFGSHSLRAFGAQIWDSIPVDTRKAVSLRDFKRLKKRPGM